MTKFANQPHKINQLKPIHDSIILSDMTFNERLTSGGIILPNDDGKNSGIRPRWCKVYAVGPERTDLQIGQYILVSHGRWSRGIKIEDSEGEKVIRKVDPDDILLVSDEPVDDDTMSDKVI